MHRPFYPSFLTLTQDGKDNDFNWTNMFSSCLILSSSKRQIWQADADVRTDLDVRGDSRELAREGGYETGVGGKAIQVTVGNRGLILLRPLRGPCRTPLTKQEGKNLGHSSTSTPFSLVGVTCLGVGVHLPAAQRKPSDWEAEVRSCRCADCPLSHR